MVLFALMGVAMGVMSVLEEDVFVSTVRGEGHRCYSKTWQAALETIPPCEGSCISPCLPIRAFVRIVSCKKLYLLTLVPMGHWLVCPKIAPTCEDRSRSDSSWEVPLCYIPVSTRSYLLHCRVDRSAYNRVGSAKVEPTQAPLEEQ